MKLMKIINTSKNEITEIQTDQITFPAQLRSCIPSYSSSRMSVPSGWYTAGPGLACPAAKFLLISVSKPSTKRREAEGINSSSYSITFRPPHMIWNSEVCTNLK